MDLKQLHQLKCELLKVYRYQGLTLQELLCEFYSHINEVINSTNGLIDIVDYLVGEGLSNEVATHLNQMLIDGTFDKIISNKVDELSTNLNNQFNEMKKIIESNISESNNLIENLRVYDSRFNNIESKNIDQDTRLKDIENKNKVQDVYLSGLFNENKDGRLTIEGEGNSLKLEGSKSGLVEVDRIVGNTFVNLSDIDVTVNLPVTPSYHVGTFYNNLVVIGKEYSIKWVTDANIMPRNIAYVGTDGYEKTLAINVNKDTFVKFTLPNDFSKFRFYITSEEVQNNVNIKMLLLEGDYTNKPIPNKYIEGLQSSFEENLVTQDMIEQGLESEENLGKYKVPVRIVGKNKFDGKWEQGGIDNIGQNNSNSNAYRCVNYIYVSNIQSIAFGYPLNIFEYDKDKNFIVKTTVTNKSHTLNPNTCYIRFYRSSLETSLQIEEGTVATEFEDYFEPTINVYLNSPLLEGDEIVMHDGELCHYHTKWEYALDVNATAWYIGSKANSDYHIYTYIDNAVNSIIPINALKTSGYLVCDKLKVSNDWSNCGEQLNGAGWYRLCNICYFPGNNITDMEEAKARLQSNHVTVVYNLAEPYYEPISTDKLLLECTNDSTLHIDSIVPVENIVASYTGNVPSVYAIEETGITNTEDIAVTQTAVDFLLMSSMGESLMISFLNNVKGINNLGSYFANRIIKKALSYDDVINKYPQFKDDIDVILINEGYEYLIK